MMRHSTERGIAMITALLVLMLMSALLVGFTTIIMSDQRFRFIDRDRGQSFYAATGAIEKLTADLGNLFLKYVAPTNTQVTNLTASTSQPAITGISYVAAVAPQPLPASQLTTYHCRGGPLPAPQTKWATTVGASGYTITFCGDASVGGKPTVSDDPLPITVGPYQGLIALQTPYQIDVTARSATGGEVHLIRTVEAVAIPVFQFGIFSDSDLSFFAEGPFGFGGRVHTNGSLYLAEGSANTLTINSRITAVKDVVRQYMSNGTAISSINMTGPINLATQGGNRNLAADEGSVVGKAGSAPTTAGGTPPASWNTISQTLYNNWLRNGATGAKALNLPMITVGVGGTNADVVRRPPPTELSTSILFNERMFAKASLRILLSDTAADITGLPTVSSTAPVYLDGDWNTAFVAGTGGLPAGPPAYGPINVATVPNVVPVVIPLPRPPVPLSPGARTTTVTGTGGGGPWNLTVPSATSAAFKPTFTLTGSPNIISCTIKNATSFSGCTGVPSVPASGVGTSLNVLSAAGGLTGISVPTLGNLAGAGTITLSGVATTAAINLLPMWNQSNNSLVTCNGLYTATQFSNCSSAPANGTTMTSAALSNAGTGVLGGYIKIEVADVTGTWTDVTLQILNWGIGGPSLGPDGTVAPYGPNGAVAGSCLDPTPNAILRLQRWRDNGGPNGGGCNYNTDTTGAKDPTNWWQNVLFDTREGVQRDQDPGTGPNVPYGGVMYYIALDAGNLAKWFKNVAPYNTVTVPVTAPLGNTARTDTSATGYTVYFSDRRNNRNGSSLETSEFGWEDFVNSGVAAGAPNDALEPAEDVNGNGTPEVYGRVPSYNGVYNAVPPGALTPLINTGAPVLPVRLVTPPQAKVNRPIIFRRALKLINGGILGSDPTVANRITGLTVVSENPVYIQGDWNAAATFLPGDLHAATAVVADSVTLLSSNWNDDNSFAYPYTPNAAPGRTRRPQSYYRLAVLAGKGINFDRPSDVAAPSVFGTDGGVHNFLRMLEGDTGSDFAAPTTTVNYRGSLASFFYNRQAVGTFKCCSGSFAHGVVYSVPNRAFVFDTDFLTPALLPPNTPVFRDMNAVGFSQELRPGK